MSAGGPGSPQGPEQLRGGSQLAVLGQPIAHSKSPRIHSAAYELLELPWSYTAMECDAAGLSPLLESLDESWRGLSLTMPLKEEAHRLARVRDPIAEESGVVNTLLRLGGASGWAGFNTDVGGLATAITEAGVDAAHTVVLGSGATAVSAVLAARSLGAQHVEIVARNERAISELVARFGGHRGPGAAEPLHVRGTPLSQFEPLLRAGLLRPTLVISTLPGPAARDIVLPERLLATPLFDVAYDPWPSPLAVRWRDAGGEAHSGLGMLVNQAILQVRIFLNGDPGYPLDREDEVRAAMNVAIAGVGE